ncbi:glycerophosphodiester phosphodiesterase family protein [Clostridium sp. WILCCON 0269]|uniref:Glycerophosphodiester phosphodiesterase family protein n=1 Tax=Candidatus Clostridium eludens TaxID=3381663 RepID=A0ABW8SNT9_9CLOT
MNKATHKSCLLISLILSMILCTSSKSSIVTFENHLNKINNILNSKKLEVISHRAKCFIDQPENSMGGIKDSVEYKVNYAEIDVQETKDGVVVLMHDKTLKRLTGLNKKVSQLSYNEIKELNIGALNLPGYMVEKIPTLEQVVKYSRGRLNLIIHIKPYGNTTDLTKKVIHIIKKNNFTNHCIIQSSNCNILTNIRELDPNIIIGYIVTNPCMNLYSMNVNFYSIEENLVTKTLIENIHNSNKKIYIWTVNSQTSMHKLINLGVDGIITDNPKLLLNIRDFTILKNKYPIN